MVKCINCGTKVDSRKSWSYTRYKVDAFTCGKCGARFREYRKNGDLAFTLKVNEKGKWKKLVRNPLFTIAMYYLRLRVATVYYLNKK